VRVDVNIPTLLGDCTGGHTRFSLEAATLAEALQRMVTTYPLLHLHLYDEAEHLRRHLLIFFNEQNVARLPHLDLPLQQGDRIAVLQNVSGG
jgi:molybdopterin synthase sulfur carrier subunit